MKQSKNILLLSAALAGALLFSALPASAHHAFSAEFDGKKPITLTGTITKLEWTNPHAHFRLAVKDETGATNEWNFELASPNGLMRHGWTRSSVTVGATVTVTGYLAKDGSKMANALSVTLPDGKKIFAGSTEEGAAPQ